MGTLMAIACTTGRELPLSEVWRLDLHVGGPGKRVATTGILENVSSDGESCQAELVDEKERVEVGARGSVCEQVRSANGRRVKVDGIASLGCMELDINLRPDGGSRPFLAINATQVQLVP